MLNDHPIGILESFAAIVPDWRVSLQPGNSQPSSCPKRAYPVVIQHQIAFTYAKPIGFCGKPIIICSPDDFVQKPWQWYLTLHDSLRCHEQRQICCGFHKDQRENIY